MLQAFCLETCFFQSWNPSRNSSENFHSWIPFRCSIYWVRRFQKSCVAFVPIWMSCVIFISGVSTLPTTKVLEMKEDQVKAPESEECVEMVIWNTWVATVVPQHLDPGNLAIFYGHIQQFKESLDKICVNGWRVKAFRLVSMEFSFDWCVHLIQKWFAFNSHRNLLSLPRCTGFFE